MTIAIIRMASAADSRKFLQQADRVHFDVSHFADSRQIDQYRFSDMAVESCANTICNDEERIPRI